MDMLSASRRNIVVLAQTDNFSVNGVAEKNNEISETMT